MGKAVFQTEIIELGEQVDAFFEEGMFVLFGENVPDTLKDFCHFIDQKKVDGTIKKGDKLVVDQKEYLITAVGDIAQSNLETLGHLTVVFSGAKEAGLPGSICVEAKPMPKLTIGSKLSIVEEYTRDIKRLVSGLYKRSYCESSNSFYCTKKKLVSDSYIFECSDNYNHVQKIIHTFLKKCKIIC